MGKEWAGKLLIGLIIYFVVFILTITFADDVAEVLGSNKMGNTTNDVTLNSTFGAQSTCGYPRYKYNTQGNPTRYFFDLDNLDCDISAGAISQNVCNAITGCAWSNVTSGFLWFREVSEQCTGTINKTFYNDGEETSENICNIEGLQGNDNILRCGTLGCSSYEPKENVAGGINNPLTILDSVGDLFLFRYDFGIEDEVLNFIVTFTLVYIPFILLLVSIYLLSPFSN